MLLEPAIVSILTASTSVADLVSNRIAIGRTRPDWQSLPDIWIHADHDDFLPTFDGSGEDTQNVHVEIIARALIASEAVTIATAARAALIAAINRQIRIGDELATPVLNVTVLDPGSISHESPVTREGTTRAVHAVSVLLNVLYRSSNDGEEAETPDPEDDPPVTTGLRRTPNSTPPIVGPQTAPITLTHNLGVTRIAGLQCYEGNTPIWIPWEPIDANRCRLLSDVPSGVTLYWVAYG